MNMRDKTFYLSTKEDIIEIYFHKYAGIIKVSVGVGSDVGNKFTPQDEQTFETYSFSVENFKIANGFDLDTDINFSDMTNNAIWLVIDQIRADELSKRTSFVDVGSKK